MTENKIKIFEDMPVHKAIIKLALPTIMAMLVSVFYNMADTFFVGKTNDPNQVAAVSLAMPIFLLLMAFGNIFGVGGASYISRKLGEKKYSEVKKISSFCFYSSIIVGIVCMIFSTIYLNSILKISGATDSIYPFAKSYLAIIIFAAPIICCQQAMGQIIRSEGASKEAMKGMMFGTIVNIILDPIMILYMNMGVSGAAIATVIGATCSIVYYIFYVCNKKTFLSISPKNFSFNKSIVCNIVSIGIPVSINNILMSSSSIIMNNFTAPYGENVLAALGISQRIFTVVVMVLIGLAQGLQPFAGYNYAAGNYKRMNKAIKFSVVISTVFGALLSFVGIKYGYNFAHVFINNAEVIKHAESFIIANFSIAPILGLQFIFMSTFQAMGKAIPSLVLSISRQGIAFIPVLFLGTRFFGLKGIVWSQPIADIVSVILSLSFYVYIYQSIKRKHSAEINELYNNSELKTEEI